MQSCLDTMSLPSSPKHLIIAIPAINMKQQPHPHILTRWSALETLPNASFIFPPQLRPNQDRGRFLDPLADRLTASPPMVASARCRVAFLSGSLSINTSIPAAPSAAVATRMPFSPVHRAGFLRILNASMAPAISAASVACSHMLRRS